MKNLTDILESLLDDKDEIADKIEKVAKEPHIALNRNCDNYDDVAKTLRDFFGVDAKIKKGDISAKWAWSGRGVKFRGAECIKFDQYTTGHDHQKCRTYKFIFWKDKLIFNMIEWVPYRTDPKTGKVYLKGYPEVLMGDNDKSKYEWGTSLWGWLSKDSRVVDSLKSIVK